MFRPRSSRETCFHKCWLRTSRGSIHSTGALSSIFVIKVGKRNLSRTQPAICLFCAFCWSWRHLVARTRTESAPNPPPPPPPRKCSENPATAVLAQNNRSCPAVTCQEWGPQGGVQGADQAALIPAEACCTAGAGRVTALGVGPVGEESACQGCSKCPAHRCGDPRVVSALAQASARCPGLEPSPTMCPPAAAVSGALLPVPRGQLCIPSPRSASVGGLLRRCFLAGRGSARHTTLV